MLWTYRDRRREAGTVPAHAQRVLLVRHGETVWNVAGRMHGQSDAPLTERGRLQADLLAARLAGEPLAAIAASDLSRALDTARTIAAPHGLDVLAEPRLRESAKGVWEGLTWEQAEARYPAETARWRADQDAPPPGGEGVSAVAARALEALDDLRRVHPVQALLLVGHGQVLRALICAALGLSPTLAWNFEMGNASVSELRYYDGEAVLHRLNDTAHLPGEERAAQA